ncbi:hypothetical protein MKW98_030437 [Papaver atlanticum]|uniref:Uncharacterized protein n=1 Tax=Papaver atlanticum TaxID=357466 RepID=A0AAD4XJS0_9MAGN|nr:hypothetical protein MKW98_030437 [Papaver atlanticum]
MNNIATLAVAQNMGEHYRLKGSKFHTTVPDSEASFAATVLHASFQTPNLKARLNTFREEFRAVWRNYREM